MKNCPSKILILGKGYIGNHLYNFLKQSCDVEIVGSSDLNYHDVHALRYYLCKNQIETVINCSGFTGRPNVDEAESRKAECWELNVNSPLRITSMCNSIGVRYIHISSGCIFTGYDKKFTEKDDPNFGLFDYSSFYSKSKHAYELGSKHMRVEVIRLRMPICNDLNSGRNYLTKIMKYPNLVDFLNSKTYVPDLCEFIGKLLQTKLYATGQIIYNVVNGEPLTTKRVIEILNENNKGNWPKLDPNWVNIEELKIAAPRSNCVLDNSKANAIYCLHTEEEILKMVCDYNNSL
jgi:dTDP-4-dehydrorhamnose reductase